jgi:tellurium resistance protein TerD
MNLKKGNRADLNGSKYIIGLGWDPSTREDEEFDLDVSAFILDETGKVLFDGTAQGEKYIVYFNSDDRILPSDLEKGNFRIEPYDSNKYPNKELDYRINTRPVSPNFEVIGSIDDTTGDVSDGDDDEEMIIDLNKIHPNAKEIIIVVSIYDSINRNNQNFGQVKNSYIRVIDSISNNEILKYELDEDFSSEDAVEFGRIYKRNDTWRFEAVGNGINGGIEYYINKYSSFLQ